MSDDKRILETQLFGFVGEDELGSGEVGIKKALCPAGYIPMVAIKREKMDDPVILAQLKLQNKRYGKTIYLVRYQAVEILKVISKG